MDGARFDELTRGLETTSGSRRKLFLGAIAGLLATTFGLRFAQMTEAARGCRRNQKRCRAGCCSKNFPVCCNKYRYCCKRGARCCVVGGVAGCCRR